MNARTLLPVAILGAIGIALSLACGPWWPRRVLHTPQAALETPPAQFAKELRRLPKRPPLPMDMGLPEKAIPEMRGPSVLHIDVADFTRATKDQRLAESYRHWRDAMRPNLAIPRNLPPPVAEEAVATFPAEFRLYGQGAKLYHEQKFAEAIAKWQEILALPEGARRHRSTWAAWMIARTTRDSLNDVTGAAEWYRKVGALTAAGFADSLELAASATGWLAKPLLDNERYAEALTLYFHQSLAGDASAPQSIRITVSKILNADDTDARLRKIARDPALRGIVTAEILCSLAGSESLPKWGFGSARTATSKKGLALLEEAGVDSAAEAEQLAWLAYADADIALAESWLSKADDDSGIALWLRAKLALRAGHDRKAAQLFKRALPHFPLETRDESIYEPRNRERKFHADLGVVSLGRSDYLQALSAFIRSGDRDDAAYIAEAVLSAEELLVYVRKRYPHPAGDEFDSWRLTAGDWIRWLLARRLAREQLYKNATEFFPPTWQNVFEEFVVHYRNGVDRSQSDADRAAALWHAAQIQRKHGMELFGYELWPDAFNHRGSYPGDISVFTRFPGSFSERLGGIIQPWRRAPSGFVPKPGDGELWRAKKFYPPVTHRFHYRYTAADLAWRAAELMPDDSEPTARILCIAGSWLKHRSPEEADRFYKALVRRNPSIPLAQEADKLRWFPEIEWRFRAKADLAQR